MIEVYPNLLDGGPCDVQTTERKYSVAEWLDEYCKKTGGYKPGDDMPLQIRIEDEIIEECDWPLTYFRPRDRVEVRVLPRGTDPFSITVALFAGVKAVFGMLMPALPGTPNTPGQGDSLSQGSVRGNKVKLGQPIRESFGTQQIYPDYLLPPHKYFSDPRTQQTRFCMNIGVGEFQINAIDVKIGETPLLSLGAEAEYQISGPNAFIGGDQSAWWWHTAPEVGASSTGAAGLELTPSTAITPFLTASSITFSGYTVTLPAGAGTFPTDWIPGMTLRMVVPYTYTVTDGASPGFRDVITGTPLSMLAPVVGQTIEIAGTNAGFYSVNSWDGTSLRLDYAGGAPANSMQVGTGPAAIGPVGLRFRIVSISPSSMTVQRLNSAGSIDGTFPGFTALTTSLATVSIDSASLEGGWRGPFPACPTGEKTTVIEFDVFFPNGLCGISKEGAVYQLVVNYEVQYRDSEVGGAWWSQGFSETDATLDQIGYTRQIAMPYPMRPEVRLRKLYPLTTNLEWHDTIQWYGLKAILNAPTSYPGCTVITGRVQISDRISAQSESRINVVATRILPKRVGGVWQAPTATREIAPAAIYVGKSLGLTDDDFDLVEIDRLASGVWASRGDHCDMAITEETTAKEVMNSIFGCGFAELTVDRGLIRPVRDEPRSTLEHAYSAQNMTEELTVDVTLKSENDFDGVEVTYQDATTWTSEVVYCRLPGDPLNGRRIEKIEAPGITDRNKAYQYGMRRRRVHEYRRDMFTFSTPGDALNSRYLSYCAVCADVPGYFGQSAILTGFQQSGDGYVMRSSEPLDWSAGGAHVIALRRPDGTVSGPYYASRIDDYRFFIIGSVDFVPDLSWNNNIDPPHLLFGAIQTWAYKILVTSVSPRGTTSAAVEAVGYDERVYLDDDSLAP